MITGYDTFEFNVTNHKKIEKDVKKYYSNFDDEQINDAPNKIFSSIFPEYKKFKCGNYDVVSKTYKFEDGELFIFTFFEIKPN